MQTIAQRLLFFTILPLLIACTSTPQRNEQEIAILEPEFTIISITVLQADLINTRFKLSLKIDNPNAFPITLLSFRYEIYGNDRFWADGVEKDLSIIPAHSSSEASFDCTMNFIGMKRQLLDDILAMRDVRYRIVGEVEMETGIALNPVLTMQFDYSGNSEVKK